jgi:predicted ATPase
MLTRIEIDGFKNLLGFSAEFGLFTCIAGPNAVGKSNLFDAIEFLSLLADHPLEQAASLVRATPGSHESARGLFWNDGQVWADRIRIAVEMIADGWVADDLGRGVELPNPKLRYELELSFNGRLRLAAERLIAVGGTSGSDFVRFPHHPSFAEAHRLDDSNPSKVIFDLEGGLMPDQGPRPNLDSARKTTLQLYDTIEHPEILAAREQMLSWRRLALDPGELRKPHVIGSARTFAASGEHLPLLMMGLIRPGDGSLDSDDEIDVDSLSAEVVAKLGPVASLRKIWVEEDIERQLLTIRATALTGEDLSARQLSDGTLRYLALILLGRQRGDHVLCIEEPENGIHPRRSAELVDNLIGLATDAVVDSTEDQQALGKYGGGALRQVIVNTHSAELVKEVYARNKGDLLMATTVLISGPEGHAARVFRLHPIRQTWRCRDGIRGVMLPVYNYINPKAAAATTPHAADEDR